LFRWCTLLRGRPLPFRVRFAPFRVRFAPF
jgi:hypothetical protein